MKFLVNLFGAPKSGKTTLMASIFSVLKLMDMNCEMAPDFPKEILFEKRFSILENQLYILAKQEKRISELYAHSDVVVTDCPLLHSIVYNNVTYKKLHPIIYELHDKYNNINILIKRTRNISYGSFKIKTIEEIIQIESDIEKMLTNYKHHVLYQCPEDINKAVAIIVETITQNIGVS